MENLIAPVRTQIRKYQSNGLKISTDKTKTMASKGRQAIGSKIIIINKIIKQINSYDYLGWILSFQGVNGVANWQNFRGNGEHQSSPETFKRPETNHTTNLQHISHFHPTIWQWNLEAKRTIQIQTHSSRGNIKKTHALWPQQKSSYSQRN